MSLANAQVGLLQAGRNAPKPPEIIAPTGALYELMRFAGESGGLHTDHPWELAAAVCRTLEARTGYAPPGGWARLAGLAAGADLLQAAPENFYPVADAESVSEHPRRSRTRLVEAFTRRLIPPAAAAALYVSLDLHPLWGLRLGREVGATQARLDPSFDAMEGAALDRAHAIVFGTIAGLLVTLRALDSDKVYPVDALGEVLWSSAECARARAGDLPRSPTIPILVDRAGAERRMVTTRLAVADLLDYVFVPAGVARRDDSGWFRVDAAALEDVRVADADAEAQLVTWGEMLATEAGVEVC